MVAVHLCVETMNCKMISLISSYHIILITINNIFFSAVKDFLAQLPTWNVMNKAESFMSCVLRPPIDRW